MYSTYNAFRARWTPHGIVKEPTGSNRGEWGVTQDDDGKMWFESGAPGVPGQLPVPDCLRQLHRARRARTGLPHPVGRAGPRRRHAGRPERDAHAGRIAEERHRRARATTSIRGHRLPKDLVGEYLYGEPVGAHRPPHPRREERRADLPHNAYPNNEFIKSLDPFFRPVDMTTAPDGTLYITDMYHGIIQVGNFAGPGTYLRARIQQYRPGQGHSQGPHLAARLRRRQARPIRRAAPRPHRPAHAQRDAGAARQAPRPSERLVARHGAAAARPEAGQVGRAGAAADGAEFDESPRALPRAVDARRARRARARAGARS